jgi:hypothetical protein
MISDRRVIDEPLAKSICRTTVEWRRRRRCSSASGHRHRRRLRRAFRADGHVPITWHDLVAS